MSNPFLNELEEPEMETLGSLADNLIYRLPGCSDIMVRKTLQEVYQDFSRRSCCLHATRLFKLGNNVNKLNVGSFFGGVIDSITEVKYNYRVLIEGTDYKVIPTGKGKVVAFRESLVPNDMVKEEYLPEIAVSHIELPILGTEKVPCWFIGKYGQAIIDGALARLHMMGNKPWTDLAVAQIENIRYENAVGEARISYYSNSDCGKFEKIVDNSDLI